AFAFLADFFADFLAFFADFLSDFFEDFFADFFFAVRSLLLFLAFLPFLFFLPLAIVILLCCRRPMSIGLFESSASRLSTSKSSTSKSLTKIVQPQSSAPKAGPIDQFKPGRGPPV